jgi:hypothetical protein
MSAQNVEHGAALLRMSFGREPGLKSRLANTALKLSQAALERGHQVWVAKFIHCDDIVTCSGA